MGYKKLSLSKISLGPFDKGFFPNKDFNDVPKGGSPDCKHVLWYRSSLRKMFGMDRINATQAATTNGNGLFYLDVNGATKRSAIFGAGFYEDVAGTWTDRTGAVAITDANLVQAINHQQGANKYSIYVNGTNPPWKWTGTGNAAVLGGSPPTFTSIAKYHDHVFGSVGEIDYFSGVGDPETWTTATRSVRFDRDIVTQFDHGVKLAVLMSDHIGSVQGFGFADFTVEETETKSVGCVGRLAASSAVWQDKYKVIATLSKDGLYLVDESFGHQQVFGNDYIDEFNSDNLNKSVVAFSKIDNLIYVAMPYGSATQNNRLIVVDAMTGAFWPMPDIHANSIRSMASMRDDNGDEFIYFIDSNGYAFKFNRTTTNYHTGTATQAIDARWQSGKIDLDDVYSFRRAALLGDADGDYNVNVSIKFGLSTGDGNTGSVNLSDEGDLLGSTFILGSSVLGGSEYVLNYLSSIAGSYGRHLTVTFTNSTISQAFHVKKLEILAKRRRMGGNDK